MTTPKLSIGELAEAQSAKYVTINTMMQVMDALVQFSVIDKDLTAPPGSETNGDMYIIAATATGAWTGKENQIAQYYNGAYSYYTPKEGWFVHVNDEDKFYLYSGSAWAEYTITIASINDITDVNITSVADGEVLTWDAATSKWINAAAASGGGGASNLTDLLDVGEAAIASVEGGKILQYGQANQPFNNYYAGKSIDPAYFSYASVSRSVTGIGTIGQAFIHPDGTSLYIMETDTENVEQYNMSVPFDISTMTQTPPDDTFSVSAQTTTGYGLGFNDDGTKMYVMAPSNCFEYDLGTAWDISTAVYNSNNFTGFTGSPNVFAWSPDGTKFLTMWGDNLYTYDASTAFDITSLTADESLDGSASFGWPSNNCASFQIFADNDPANPGGFRILWASQATDGGFFEFIINSAYSLSGGSEGGRWIPEDNIGLHNEAGLFFDTTGLVCFFARTDGTMYEYNYLYKGAGYSVSSPQTLIVEEAYASGSAGGGFTSGSWVTRALNTERLNNLPHGIGGYLRDLPYDGEGSDAIVADDICIDATSGATGFVSDKTDAGATGNFYLTQVTGTYGDNNVVNDWKYPLAAANVNNLTPDDSGTGTDHTNQIWLEDGTYEAEAWAIAYGVDNHKIKLYNVTGAADLIIGSNADAPSGTATTSHLSGTFTITGGGARVELRHRCTTTNGTDGLGQAASFTVEEVFASVKIRKVA